MSCVGIFHSVAFFSCKEEGDWKIDEETKSRKVEIWRVKREDQGGKRFRERKD